MQRLIAEHLDESPEKLALKWRGTSIPSSLIAQQIKYLQKAKTKLPEWFAAQCIFTRTTYEQCSSSATVELKFEGKGKRALDLTCGQGVDAWGLAQHFESVVAVDRDPVKVEMAKANFAKLGCLNIQVQEADAEAFLSHQPDFSFDLLYIDPARRDDADRRKVTFAECEPDILPMLPHMLRVARQVWIKGSPMKRIEDALEELGMPATVRVLAVQGECREVLFIVGKGIEASREARWLRDGKTFRAIGKAESHFQSKFVLPAMPAIVLEADVSLYKAEIAGDWFAQWPSVRMNHPQGYGFGQEIPEGFGGRAFRIVEMLEYKPKLLKKKLKEIGWRKAHITTRNFDLSVAQVRTALGIQEGEDGWILLTRIPGGERIALLGNREK